MASVVWRRGYKSQCRNVTRHNFGEALAEINGFIREADFVGLRVEAWGGLAAGSGSGSGSSLDTPQTLYPRLLRRSALNYGVFQLGLCPFKWIPHQNRFLASPYNFNLFPRNELKLSNFRHGFFCQNDTIRSLTRFGFDFNACVQDGISYLSKQQEAVAWAQLKRFGNTCNNIAMKVEDANPEDLNPQIGLENKGFIEGVKRRLEQWIQTCNTISTTESLCEDGNAEKSIQDCHGNGTQNSNESDEERQFMTAVNNGEGLGTRNDDRPSLTIQVFNGRQLRLVLEFVQKHLALVPIVKMQSSEYDMQFKKLRNHTSQLVFALVEVVYTKSVEEKAKLLETVNQSERLKEEKQIHEAVGFRHVIDALIASQKPIVGHGCLLDFAHIFDKFFAPLPEDIEKFCSNVLNNFECIIDTKNLTSVHSSTVNEEHNPSLKQISSLAKAYAERGGKISVEIDEEFTNKFSHVPDARLELNEEYAVEEAGYKAFMSGCLFAETLGLSQMNTQDIPNISSVSNGVLANRYNLLCLEQPSPIVWDLKSLKEGVKSPDCSDVALVWGFCNGISIPKLLSLVQNALPEAEFGILDASFVDDSAALIKFKQSEDAKQFIKLVQNLHKDLPIVVPEAHGLRAASFGIYESLCKLTTPTGRLSDYLNMLKDGAVYFESPVNGKSEEVAIGADVECEHGLHDGKTGRISSTDSILNQTRSEHVEYQHATGIQ